MISNDNIVNVDKMIKEVYRYDVVTQNEINNLRVFLVRLNKKIQQTIKARIILLEKDNYITLIFL